MQFLRGMDPSAHLLGVGVVVALTIAFLLKPAWVVGGAARLLLIAAVVLKWLFVVGLVVSFSCCPQMYCATGWTPASALFGDDLYTRAMDCPGRQPKLVSPRRAKGLR